MKRITLVIALWAVFVASASAQKGGTEQQLAKEANELFTSGDFLKAYPLYSQLVSLYPQNANYSYRFGTCAIYSDPDKAKAIQFLNSAAKRNVDDVMVYYYLGKAYHLNYQFKEAVSAYENFVSKADPKITAKYNAQREIETCIYGSNLLSNIKDIVVINKTETDKDNFFRYMNLEGIGGKIVSVPAELQTKLDQKSTSPRVMYSSGNSSTIYFSSLGIDGSTGKDIYSAQVLPDGKFSVPVKVVGDVNTKYDEDFCFLHSDGKTLYFSSKGHNSMGGYDIFRSEMDPRTGEFGPAINMDFAINTPDDDIFFIADSLNQKAYFASARTSDQNHLHVYNVLVQGIPLQIVYLKGEFVSEIDAEQKQATVQVRDEMTGRIVIESTTSKTTGNYTVYVPKGGDYTYYVKTENSPVVHEAKVTVPSFDKPVAFRQEIRLLKENGKEKLVVNNYFDTSLQEDISTLASEMLRRKAGLDVSDSPLLVAEIGGAGNDLAIEKTMENAPLAAGFGAGVTVESVISDMEKEVAIVRSFVAEADKKYNSAYVYAQKKQKEADAALIEAERLSKATSNYTSDEDVKKLRESQEYLAKSQELQREAKAAMIAAEAVKTYRETESQRADAIAENLTALKKAKSENNFDNVLAELNEEKARIVASREGNGNPQAEMAAKARAKESVLHNAEDKLMNLREEEKEVVQHLAAAEEKVANSKKKNDKVAAENEVANSRAELDNIRREIVAQKEKTQTLGNESKEAYAGAIMFEKLSAQSTLGQPESDIVKMESAQKDALAMKLSAMETRFEALEITDPQTLALLGELAKNDQVPTTNDQRIVTSDGQTNTSADVGSTSNQLPTTNNQLPTTNNQLPTTVSEIKSLNAPVLTVIGAPSPANAPSRRMILSNSLVQTEERIEEIQKKRATGINSDEKVELQNLIAYRSELNKEIAATSKAALPVASKEQARETATNVDPAFVATIQTIENSDANEVEQTSQRVAYQKEVIEKLEAEKAQNAAKAAASTDAAQIAEIAKRDQQLEAAISYLTKETENIGQYKAAFDSENKSIIESTADTRSKLEDQIGLTQNYMNTLESLEAEKQEQLAVCTDLKEGEEIRMSIGEIKKEYQTAESKMTSYQSDLSLTTSASEPVIVENTTTTATTTPSATSQEPTTNTPLPSTNNLPPTTSLEEVVEADIADRQMGAEKISAKMNEGEMTEKIEKDAELIKETFKPHQEAESLFAYESGDVEKLYQEYGSQAGELKETAKIAEIQNNILLIEAEIESESNAKKQAKMDKKAEKLYFQRAKLEMVNAPVIAEMSRLEFEKVVAEVDALNTDNQEELNSRTMLRDEVRKLYNQAKKEYEDAQELRKQAGPKTDDIEKNDYYRQAFAKESHAIAMMQQIQEIHGNMETLLEYDDQELAELRYGNPADVRKSSTKEEVATTTPVATTTTPSTDVAVDSKTVKSEVTAPEVASTTPSTSNAASKSTSNSTAESTASAAGEGTGSAGGYYADGEASNYFFESPEFLTKNLYVRTRGAVYSSDRPIPVDTRLPKGVYYAVQIGAFRNAIPQNLYNEFAPIHGETIKEGVTRYTAGFFLDFDNADQVKLDIRRMGYSDAFVVAYRDGKRIPLYEAMGKTEKDLMASVEKEYVYGDGGEAPVKATTNTTSTNTAATATPTANSQQPKANSQEPKADYYKGYPNAAKATQVETVTGLFYTIQVGVYSKPTPASNMKNISPLNSELTATQKIRYTSGIYNNLEAAVAQRDAAKALGITDAFITAYYNGVRITLSEADRLLKENGTTILVK
jgi:hypothetical protein